MVPLQETPPPGWPHTEAEKHHTSLHAAPPPEGRPPVPRLASRRRGGCCALGLILLLVVAVGFAIGVAALSGAFGEDDSEAATQVFLDAHPDWQVESADALEGGSGAIRLVAWDYSRNIGRLVTMLPDTLVESGWSEEPLIEAMPGDSATEEAFLDEFGRVFASTSWTYAVRVEASDIVADPQTWRVWYRVWEQDSETWAGESDTWATRDRDSTEWVIGEPGSEPEADENTSTP